MIREVAGDILLSKVDAIAHGIAPGDHFDGGLALALRERWPALAKDFRHHCRQTSPKTGAAWAWTGTRAGHGSVTIVSLMTQEPAEREGSHPGRATTHNVNLALKELARLVEQEGYRSVALPRLATGVGGLPWSEVRPLIERQLGRLEIPVILYTTYHPDVAADEPLPARS